MCKATNVFLRAQLCIVFKEIKYMNLPRLFSIVLYACLGETTIPLVSWAWGAFGISYTKKNPLQLCFTMLRRKAAVFLYQNLIMRCYVTILTEIYDDPTFFGSGPGFVNRTQSDPGFVNPVRSGPGFVNPIRSDPVQVLLTPFLCWHFTRASRPLLVGFLSRYSYFLSGSLRSGILCEIDSDLFVFSYQDCFVNTLVTRV